MRQESKWYIIFLLMLLSSILRGQTSYEFQNLTKKDGLSQASVFAITQDSFGFMWFGTKEGLNKYDGYQFKIYENNDDTTSIIANDIRTIYYDDSLQNLWIGTTGGLSKYLSTTDNFINYNHRLEDTTSISNNLIRDIYKDSEGRLWIGTSIGLNLLDQNTGKFTRYYFTDRSSATVQSNDVKTILEDQEGKLWFGTNNGLYRLDVSPDGSFQFKRSNLNSQLSNLHVKDMIEDSKGNLWMGTLEGGINYWNRKEDKVIQYKNQKKNPNSLSNNHIRTLCFDKYENLWIGTFDGLNYLEKGSDVFKRFTKYINTSSGLSDKSIRSLYIDKRESLWVGTYYGGINLLDEIFIRFKNTKHSQVGNSLRGEVVSPIVEDNNKNLWIGTEGDGLHYYDKATKQLVNFKHDANDPNTIGGNNVKELLLDQDKLWIGTFQAGLNVYNLKTKKFKIYKAESNNGNSLSSNNIYNLLKEDNLMWITTFGGGLDILNLETGKFSNYSHIADDKNSLSSVFTRVILKTRTGSIWIGTDNGINKVSTNQDHYPVSFDRYLSTESIYSMIEDSKGNLLIGTVSNGFFTMHPKTNVLTQYTMREGLPGNTVFGIVEVSDEEIWISTNNGLSKFNPKAKTFTNYDYSNGLNNTEYNHNSYYMDSEGYLLFGGLNGLTYFNPKAIKPNTYVAPVVFTDLRKNNQAVNVGDETGLLESSINETEVVTFKYNEANFSIDFAVLDYFSPESNHYAFMLEGIDNDWKYTVGKRDATYTIQNSGDYTFKLKGGNSDGLWNPVQRTLKIKVLPPPWRTWWAYLIYSLIAVAVAISTYRYFKLWQNIQVEKVVNHQQKELNEAKLRFFTNITHEFRTPLTLIIAPLTDLLSKENLSASATSQLKTVERNANRMLNLVNQILTFRKLDSDHSDLVVRQGNIVIFLKEIYLLFQDSADRKSIRYEFESESEQIDIWFDQEKLEKVIFNLLPNAFKFTPDNESIRIGITETNSMVEISVSDSGIGIKPEFRNQIFKRYYEKPSSQSSNIKGSGIGLAISKQMVDLHHGKIFLAEDSDNRFTRGTTFTIQLQKGNKHFDQLGLTDYPVTDYTDMDSLSSIDYPTLIDNETSIDTAAAAANTKPSAEGLSILIVEDNTEIRQFISSIFVSDYTVFTAVNGMEGLKKAKSKLPDLIISDVMMPVKDGITLCKEIKSDFEISHIPVILLTARAAALFKIEGLKTGADDYVTKPFNPDELRLRVRNIINSRQKIRDKFKRVLTLNPKEISVTSADELFLEKVLQIIETQMANPDYKVDQFANDLAVSRPLLFTKLKALTGQTPNNFIKSMRLKRAAQLLKSQKLSIAETAYNAGFRDVKYFSKCFKEQFVMSPTDYKQAHSS